MAKQIIQTGAIANDKTGDPLRTAFTKINQNFTELYDANEALVIPVDISDLTDTEGLLNGNANTGDVTFDGIKIIGAGEDSGDGNGYATLELVPDPTLYINDQYLVIDPTEVNHIHIRAGGTQDDSSAELYLGGEKHNVRVTDGNGVRLKAEYTTDNYYYYDLSEFGFSNGTWFTLDGNNYIEFTTTNPTMIGHFWDFANGSPNDLTAYWDNGDSSEIVEPAGWAGNPEPNVYRVQVVQPPPTDPITLYAINFHLFTTSNNELILENNDFRVEVGDDIRMYAKDVFRLYNYSVEEPIEIITDWDNSGYRWAFNTNGTITFPDNSVQTAAAISLSDLKTLVAASTSFEDFQTRIAAL